MRWRNIFASREKGGELSGPFFAALSRVDCSLSSRSNREKYIQPANLRRGLLYAISEEMPAKADAARRSEGGK